jgi:hypothetical protein
VSQKVFLRTVCFSEEFLKSSVFIFSGLTAINSMVGFYHYG